MLTALYAEKQRKEEIMEPFKAKEADELAHGSRSRGSVVVELLLGDAAPTFNLEKAVCSHGLFMMAPNHWDPISKTLQRPLRLVPYDGNGDDETTSVIVRVSHPSDSPHSLHLQVFDTDSISPQQEQSLRAQVKRMLRLSDEENRKVKEFQEVCREAKERGFGRVFRSPTLFEDMVKCILLCNCQWSRTLSMARALCELQQEMQHFASNHNSNFKAQNAGIKNFVPRTPVGKELKKKARVPKRPQNSNHNFKRIKAAIEEDVLLKTGVGPEEIGQLSGPSSIVPQEKDGIFRDCEICCGSAELYSVDSCSFSDLYSSEGTEMHSYIKIGNFPSARELASLDEDLLARRCNLGYRAGRILNLARNISEGQIILKELEEACIDPFLSKYHELAEQLKEIDGFGPFTAANVLMCLGYYHVIPTDSETIRHLMQVHSKRSSLRTVQKDVEEMYGKYAPFQFLAYWSEIWHFYEEWFGRLSEMPHSNYKLITAANMKRKKIAKAGYH